MLATDWALWVQAIAGLGTMFIAAGGIWLALRQIKELSATVRSNTNEQLTSESFEILRFLAEIEGSYDYFYNGKEPAGDWPEWLKYATEMLTNYLEHVMIQRDTLPEDAQECWETFVRDIYAHSPAMRTYIAQNGAQYQSCLRELANKVEPLLTA